MNSDSLNYEIAVTHSTLCIKGLKGTSEHGLLYEANYLVGDLKIFSDADFADDEITRKSRTGILCLYSGGAITWSSQKQKSIVLSTTEAEYVAAIEATKEIIWLARLFCEISVLNPGELAIENFSHGAQLV